MKMPRPGTPMFRKRSTEFAPGTFIPTPARMVAIIQLCLAFSLLLWQMSQPFMGDLFRVKSQMLIYQDVMGLQNSERNAERFAQLSVEDKIPLEKQYQLLEEELRSTFGQKMKKLLHLMFYQISFFELAWIILSIIVPILLLKRTEGARDAVWLLPLLALLFLFEHQRQEFNPSQEISIYPSEQEIVQNYLKKPLSSNILKQREELLRGWNLYLIKNWTKEIPSEDPLIFKDQAEQGEFMFNIHRLKQNSFKNPPKTSLFMLCIYLGWNLFFAWMINHHMKSINTPIPAK
jgi:hypothetical protein